MDEIDSVISGIFILGAIFGWIVTTLVNDVVRTEWFRDKARKF